MSYNGLDVSHYQSSINYTSVKNSGKKIAIIKATQGKTGTDAACGTHYTGFKNAGVKIGFYHYFVSTSTPIEQADHFCDVISKYSYDVYPVIDVEENWSTLVADVKTFCERVKSRLGVSNVIIYANKNYVKNIINNSSLYNYLLWNANYGVNDGTVCTSAYQGGFKKLVGFQYTSVGSVSGISGNVDLDIFYDGILMSQPSSTDTKAEAIAAGASYLGTTFKIKLLQYCLNAVGYSLTVNGKFGESTYDALIAYQSKKSLTPDGKAGKLTFTALRNDIKTVTCKINGGKATHNKIIQHLLKITADGIFGSGTKTAVINYQTSKSLTADGIVGLNTWTSLFSTYC